jgi:uncharacterized protein YkwD
VEALLPPSRREQADEGLMVKLYPLLGRVLVVLGLVVGASQAPAALAAPTPIVAVANGATVALDPAEAQVRTQLLDARLLSGDSAPHLDPTLVAIARARSRDMAARGYFSHYTPEGTTFFDLLDASNVDWSYAGETLARNNAAPAQSAQLAATGLLQSPHHRAIILDPRYQAMGVGDAVASDGMHYYTVIFVQR